MRRFEQRIRRLELASAPKMAPFRVFLVDETGMIAGSFPSVEAIGETGPNDMAITITFVDPGGDDGE